MLDCVCDCALKLLTFLFQFLAHWSRFLEIKASGEVTEDVAQELKMLVAEPDVETAIRLGDAYAMLIE